MSENVCSSLCRKILPFMNIRLLRVQFLYIFTFLRARRTETASTYFLFNSLSSFIECHKRLSSMISKKKSLCMSLDINCFYSHMFDNFIMQIWFSFCSALFFFVFKMGGQISHKVSQTKL